MKKIAVLTGGGDCPGLNAVLRSLVLTLEGAGGPEVVGLCDAYLGLLEDPPRVMHLDGRRSTAFWLKVEPFSEHRIQVTLSLGMTAKIAVTLCSSV